MKKNFSEDFNLKVQSRCATTFQLFQKVSCTGATSFLVFLKVSNTGVMTFQVILKVQSSRATSFQEIGKHRHHFVLKISCIGCASSLVGLPKIRKNIAELVKYQLKILIVFKYFWRMGVFREKTKVDVSVNYHTTRQTFDRKERNIVTCN